MSTSAMCESAAGSDFSELERQMMREALALAQAASAHGEVPIGALLYTEAGDVVASAYNETIASHDVSSHAEVLALRRAGELRRNHRLPDLHMAVTLEPCVMCIGAVFHARLRRVNYGAPDPKGGACGRVVNLPSYKELNHHTRVRGGLMAEESAALLRAFFSARR